jgi:hypothetical protein
MLSASNVTRRAVTWMGTTAWTRRERSARVRRGGVRAMFGSGRSDHAAPLGKQGFVGQ